jgi:hypothetical protein
LLQYQVELLNDKYSIQLYRFILYSATCKYYDVDFKIAKSIGNKHASLSNLISSSYCDFFAVTETWHESSTCPKLIACTPQGYGCVESTRPRKKTLSVSTNHVCLFHKSTYRVRGITICLCIHLPSSWLCLQTARPQSTCSLSSIGLAPWRQAHSSFKSMIFCQVPT